MFWEWKLFKDWEFKVDWSSYLIVIDSQGDLGNITLPGQSSERSRGFLLSMQAHLSCAVSWPALSYTPMEPRLHALGWDKKYAVRFHVSAFPTLVFYEGITSTLLIHCLRLKFEIEGHFLNNLLQPPHFTEEESEIQKGEAICPQSHKELKILQWSFCSIHWKMEETTNHFHKPTL